MANVNVVTCFLAALWMPIFFHFVLSGVVEKKRLYIGNFISWAIILIASLLLANEISLIIACVVIAVIFMTVYKCKKIQLIYIPLAYVMVVICNYAVEVLFIELGFIDDLSNISDSLGMILMWVITILILIVSNIVALVIRLIKNTYELPRHRELSILIGGNLALCTIAFLINGWATRKTDFTGMVATTNLLIFGGYMFLTILISVATFWVYGDRQRMRREKEQYESLKEYTSQIEAMYQGVRAFKHDYINILTSISGYLEAENYDELKTYFNESILQESHKLIQDDFKLNQLSNIKDPGFKGLASSKLMYAHELGIKVVIDILEEINDFYINIFDFNRIMGIYFDNAIEAARECAGDKEIRFNIVKEEKSTVVILMNTCNADGIKLGRLDEQGYSTKGESRGLGLYNVKEILRKYKNVSKSTSIEDDFFVQTLILQK